MGWFSGQRAYLPLWHSEFETCWCFFVPQSFEKNEKIKRGRQYHVKISLAFLHAKEVPTQPQKRLQPSLNKVALQSQWCKLLNPILICTSVSLVGGKFNFLTVASRKSMTKRFWSSTFSNRFLCAFLCSQFFFSGIEQLKHKINHFLQKQNSTTSLNYK